MNLPNTAMYIKGSTDHWIDINGDVYALDNRYNDKRLIKKTQYTVHGYKYCGIVYNGNTVNKRVHRLVAEAFIPNPNKYNIVGHRNNIKSDNRIENLYWTTIEKDAKSFDNKKDNSHSMPVNMYSTTTNEYIATYDSIREASIKTGISAATISRQAKYKRPVKKQYYFRYVDDESITNNNIIGCFSFFTDRLLKTYHTISKASTDNKIPKEYIQSCLDNNIKPEQNMYGVYFLYLINK